MYNHSPILKVFNIQSKTLKCFSTLISFKHILLIVQKDLTTSKVYVNPLSTTVKKLTAIIAISEEYTCIIIV